MSPEPEVQVRSDGELGISPKEGGRGGTLLSRGPWGYPPSQDTDVGDEKTWTEAGLGSKTTQGS